MTPFEISAGDTAWVLTSAALVLLMTPGLAFFYGGMVRANSVLNMLMMSFVTMAIVGVLWVLYGYGLAFGDSVCGVIGNPLPLVGLAAALSPTAAVGSVPALAFVGFQGAFAIVAVALVSGAVADRMSFRAWMLFTAAWATLVYFPEAHWVFAADGLTAAHGGFLVNSVKAVDFAGGTAIHINAGAAALVMALVVRKRIGFGSQPMRPHNMTLVMLGAGLLWFGWFGFNAGSALGAGWTAAFAWVNTLVATGAAMLAWLVTERVRDGHYTSLGAASGAVAGLVGITPGCAAVSPLGAIGIGVLAGVGCALAVGLKDRLGYDDSLDVVGVHLVGGVLGTLAVGLFATSTAPAAVNGLLYGGGLRQLTAQALGAAAVLTYSVVMTLGIGLTLKATVGVRVSPRAELDGIDLTEHAEVGYDLSSVRYTSYRVNQSLVVPTRETETIS